jgi:mannose-6-phosphate isomerase-like protein (cupin superfamily)
MNMIVHKENMRTQDWVKIHGGTGIIDAQHVFEADDMAGKCTLCAKCVFHPGDSIGQHVHETNAEIYYVLEGELVVTEGEKEYVLRPGDGAFTTGGASHRVENRTQQTASMLAVIIP